MNFPITELKLKDKEYSKLLAQIADPPKQLYCRGNTKLLNGFCFSVVGTRKLTAYGKEATEHIISGLAGSGMTIVSGLAMGIDAVAHQSALDNDLPTIAVLGSTVDDRGIGPQVNFNLAKEILKNNGLLISEYKKSGEIIRANFAIRDRIISGLSKGVLVVEGAEKSGSLITAKSALDQNRDVFAVPGNIFSPVSRGTNWLLKIGAKAVTSAEDILEEYAKNPKLKLEIKSDISTKDPIQQKILDILDEKSELTGDEIIREAGIDTSQVIAALSMLEIKNR
ncbi:MAG: DNA protecting protein DprA, partial [Candidatus Yanofskybacteria bacterium RIFCSPHIGHO2_01_FULL_39_8b]